MPTNGIEKYYLGLEKGLEKVRIFVSVEVWEPCLMPEGRGWENWDDMNTNA